MLIAGIMSKQKGTSLSAGVAILLHSITSIYSAVPLYSSHRSVKNSVYDQEIPQSQTADKLMAPRESTTQQSQDTRKTK